MMKKLLAIFFIIVIVIECNMPCAVASVSDESSKERAIEIEELDTLYYGTISKVGQKNWYKLTTGAEDAYYHFTLDNESGDSKNLCLYNEREKILLSFRANNGSGTKNIKLETDTTYYLCVFGELGTGNYSLKASKKVDEIGDERKEAMEIDMDTIYYQSIDGYGDEDWYCIVTGSEAAECSFYLKNESINDPLWMKVYNERDTQLLQVGSLNYGKETTSSIKLEPNAKYYLRVALAYRNTGNYAFEILQCANGHTPSETWTTTLEPTCLSNGEKSKICLICGKTVQTESMDALGHEYVNEETVKEATPFSLGSKKAVCVRCGDAAYFKDWSKAWILPLVIVGCVAVLIGVINYARVFSKSRR